MKIYQSFIESECAKVFTKHNLWFEYLSVMLFVGKMGYAYKHTNENYVAYDLAKELNLNKAKTELLIKVLSYYELYKHENGYAIFVNVGDISKDKQRQEESELNWDDLINGLCD